MLGILDMESAMVWLMLRYISTEPVVFTGCVMNMMPTINAVLLLNVAQSFSIFNSRYTTNPIDIPYTTTTTAVSIAAEKPP